MDDAVKLADLAAQLADRSRTTMVLSLMDGSSRPASELALLANLSAASASMHLAKLVRSGLLVARSQGRNKYYRIATPSMAHAVEALGVASQSLTVHARSERTLLSNPWGFARTCYDHLAGKLGVELALALQHRAYVKVTGRDFELTMAGEPGCKKWVSTGRLWRVRSVCLRPSASTGRNGVTISPVPWAARC
jgi:DNA-binding transcriptional ArsR family regulator